MVDEAGEQIDFQCGCGAHIKAPRRAAGRRARCPKCRQTFLLTAPAPSASPAPAHAAPVTPSLPQGNSTTAERIRLQCECGTRLVVPASASGRAVKCPKCARIITVPEPEEPLRLAPVDALPPLESLLEGLSAGEAVASPRPAGDVYGFAPRAPSETVDDSGEPPAAAGPPRVCPSCGKSLPGSAVLCIDCGVDLKTGRALLTTDDGDLDRTYTRAEGLIRLLSWLIPLGIYPIASEAFGLRKPWVTRGVALLTIIVSLWYFGAYTYRDDKDPALAKLMLWSGDPSRASVDSAKLVRELRRMGADAVDVEDLRDALAERDAQRCRFSTPQLVTHALLHGDPLHLAGNLLFLLVLGSRVNALVGNTLTVLLYPLLAIAGGVAHVLSRSHAPLSPMLGASGAIMGLAGMYLVLFPVHRVHMALWFRWGWLGAFRLNLRLFPVRGFWVVLFYIAFDVVFTLWRRETDSVAHWAHLGGFIAGIVCALVLLFARLVNARGGDVLSAILGRYAWALLGKPSDRRLSLW